MKTRSGVGLSQSADAVEAGRAAAQAALESAGSQRADWGLVFATTAHRPHFAPMLAAIQETLQTGSISGCSAWGVIAGGSEIEGEQGVAILAVESESIAGAPHLAAAGDDAGAEAARDLGRRVAGHQGLLLTFPDPFAARPDLVVREINQAAPGVPMVGAAASAGPRVPGTFQFHGRNVATRALASLHLSGRVRASFGITQGCQPLGPPCRITRCRDNTIIEIDGRPALQALRRLLPGAVGEALDRLGGHLFVGLPPDPDQDQIASGEYLVRPLVSADVEEETLALGEPVREGSPILFVLREGQAARDDLK
jgi:small ligand-binding sensory domain FIST